MISESKRRSFYASAEGIVKATIASNIKNEEDYGDYFLEHESITFKFSKNEGKEGESVELVNGKKIKLSFEGKSPVGGEVKLYKNGDVEVVNLTDGTYFANKDTDTELVVSDTTESLTRGELQIALEKLQKDVKDLQDENKLLKEKDKTLENNINSIDVLAKTYPVGSIYISENSTNPSTIFGGTWESYGAGRTLVGVGTGTDSNNKSKTFAVKQTAGEYTHKLTVAEIASHTHVQNAHTHALSTGTVSTKNLVGYFWNVVYQQKELMGSASGIVSTGAGVKESAMVNGTEWVTNTDEGFKINASHNHTLSGNAENVTAVNQNTGGDEPHNNMQPYITVYMWKRVA